jgi:hypothetical protein
MKEKSGLDVMKIKIEPIITTDLPKLVESLRRFNFFIDSSYKTIEGDEEFFISTSNPSLKDFQQCIKIFQEKFNPTYLLKTEDPVISYRETSKE